MTVSKTFPLRCVNLLTMLMLFAVPANAQPVDGDVIDWTHLPAPPVDVRPPDDRPEAARLLDHRLTELEKARSNGDFEWIMIQLETLHREHPDNGEVLWRLARTRTDVAERRKDMDERRDLVFHALEEAERAVQLLPESSNAHLTMAVAGGRAAMLSGTRQKIELSRTVREYADKAVELDPKNDLAYHVRGRWHYEVADLGFLSRNIVRIVYGGLPDASFRQAESDYRRAIEIEDRVVHRYELGRVLMERGQKAEARRQLQKAIEMPLGDVTDPIYKEHAQNLLGRM